MADDRRRKPPRSGAYGGSYRPFDNPLGWSFSRAKKLEGCARSYYYQYYLSHAGKLPGAPADARHAYILRRMTDLFLLAGSVVHRVIEEVIGDLGREGCLVPLPLARERARSLLNDAWRESRQGAWRERPNDRTNLLEHYYLKPVTRSRVHEIRERVFTCLKNFYASRALGVIRSTPPEEWLAVEDGGAFEVDGARAIVRPDVVVRRPTGDVHIYDWKTGEASPDHLDQLGAYGMFSVRAYEVAPERVVVAPVYLLTGESRPLRLDGTAVLRAEAMIRQDLCAMRERLADPQRNIARIDDFEMTRDVTLCARCPFQELCIPNLLSRHGRLPFDYRGSRGVVEHSAEQANPLSALP